MLRSRRLSWVMLLAFAPVLGGCGSSSKSVDTVNRPKESPPPKPAEPAKEPVAKAEPKVEVVAAPPAPKFLISPGSSKIEPGDTGVQLLLAGEGEKGGRLDRTSEASWTADPADIVIVGKDG